MCSILFWIIHKVRWLNIKYCGLISKRGRDDIEASSRIVVLRVFGDTSGATGSNNKRKTRHNSKKLKYNI